MDTPIPNDLEAFWMPFSPNRAFKADPRMVVKGEGVHYWTADGRQILDGMSGLWCVNAGHGRPEIAEAIAQQVLELDYAPSYQVAHPKAFEMANRVSAMMPDGLDHVFFTNSGSEAVDSALKIALAYHKANGQASRTKLIGRSRAFHGSGFGGISVGGMQANRKDYGNLLSDIDHLPHTHSLEHSAFSRGQPEWGAHLADALEDLVDLHGAETIAAVIVEPMAGSTGVLPPPVGYLERLREISARHGILLILDEVITAFGRLGAGSAAERFGVTPDLMCIAKALTNATVPMGAAVVHDDVHAVFMDAPDGATELYHGYTYSGHPVASAAGLATLDIYAREGLFQRAQDLAPHFEDAVHGLRDCPHVIDIRNIGLAAGIELEPRAGAPSTRAHEVFVEAFKSGALIRYTGDTLALSPPLVAEKDHIDQLAAIVKSALEAAA
ncbi:MAG: aspartate aminotransferase family protein [Rhodospirillales bacterium]|nr:aspartate aminotransferase family protein [Rhodospirillales bacterium]